MTYVDEIIGELKSWLNCVDENEVDKLIKELLKSDLVVGYGAGRMGLSLKAFIMRLNHLGIKAYYYTDTYIPPLTENSIFLFASGSGNTRTVKDLASTAKIKSKCRICSFVGDERSSLANISDIKIVFKSCNGGLNAADSAEKLDSVQLMSTLNEQGIYILCDIIARKIAVCKGISTSGAKQFHSNVE